MFCKKTISMLSPCSITECNAKIFDAVHGKGNYSFDGFWEKNRFRIYYDSGIRNSFVHIFHGELFEENKQTKIQGEFRMMLFVKIFMAIWNFILLLFALLIVTFQSVSFLWIILVFMLFEGVMFTIAGYMNRIYDQYILEFFEKELHAVKEQEKN